MIFLSPLITELSDIYQNFLSLPYFFLGSIFIIYIFSGCLNRSLDNI